MSTTVDEHQGGFIGILQAISLFSTARLSIVRLAMQRKSGNVYCYQTCSPDNAGTDIGSDIATFAS